VKRCIVRWINQPSRLMKGRNLTSDDAVNWQLWRLKTRDCWTTGKLIYTVYIRFNSYYRCTYVYVYRKIYI